jgi:hypothetical protein
MAILLFKFIEICDTVLGLSFATLFTVICLLFIFLIFDIILATFHYNFCSLLNF